MTTAGTTGGGEDASKIVSYEIAIDSVRRVGNTSTLGKKRLPKENTISIYRDSLITATFGLSGGTLLTGIDNQSDRSIQLNLEQGAFVLPLGTSSRIVRGNMSYANRNRKVQPVTIPGGASASPDLIPESNVRMGEYDVRVDGIFRPAFVGGGPAAAQIASTGTRQEVRENIGRTFQLLLPVEFEDQTVEYTFIFRAVGAQIGNDGDPDQETIGR